MKFQNGDRFIRTGGDKVWNKSGQDHDFKTGVIFGNSQERANGGGGCECAQQTCVTYPVNFDGYDYQLGTWPTNCHKVAECLLDHEVSDEDIEAAITSIKAAIH